MKLKQVDRCSCIAWSPLTENGGLLAGATRAGTIDTSFDSSSHLEIYSVDLGNKSDELPLKSRKYELSDRVSCLCWTSSPTLSRGLVAAGLQSGTVNLYNPQLLLDDEDGDAQVASVTKHSAAVRTMDVNAFNSNLLATGSGQSEIFIWDLKNHDAPDVYKPGPTTGGGDDVVACVAWNKNVAHILGTANQNGKVVVWDLRAKKPLMSFTDPNGKLKRCNSIAWRPDQGTQLITASEDDANPVMQLWDLRNTHSPVKYFEGHQKGVWSLSWCPLDSNFLLSCGKDNKTLCWDVAAGMVLEEVETTSQWNFDVQWSPILPAVFATASLEPSVKVFSVHDVGSKSGGGDIFSPQSGDRAQPSSPPKWLVPTNGVAFGFGGKMISFRSSEPKSVTLECTSWDNELLQRADELEAVLNGDRADLAGFCKNRAENQSMSDTEREMWSFLGISLVDEPRSQLLGQLGYDPETIEAQLQKYKDSLASVSQEPGEEEPKPENPTNDTEVAEDEPNSAGLFGNDSQGDEDVASLFGGAPPADDPFSSISSQPEVAAPPFIGETPVASSPVSSKMQSISELAQAVKSRLNLRVDGSEEDSIPLKALISGNFQGAVDCYLQNGRWAEALVLAACGGPEIWKKTQDAFFAKQTSPAMRVVCHVVNQDLRSLVAASDLSQWRVTLAILCTYAGPEDFTSLCRDLATVLQDSGDTHAATLCSIVAGDVESVVKLWVAQGQNLPDLIEKVSLLQRAGSANVAGPQLSDKFSEYAEVLVSQGRVDAALKYLQHGGNSQKAAVLLDRVSQHTGSGGQPFPFQQVEVSDHPADNIVHSGIEQTSSSVVDHAAFADAFGTSTQSEGQPQNWASSVLPAGGDSSQASTIVPSNAAGQDSWGSAVTPASSQAGVAVPAQQPPQQLSYQQPAQPQQQPAQTQPLQPVQTQPQQQPAQTQPLQPVQTQPLQPSQPTPQQQMPAIMQPMSIAQPSVENTVAPPQAFQPEAGAGNEGVLPPPAAATSSDVQPASSEQSAEGSKVMEQMHLVLESYRQAYASDPRKTKLIENAEGRFPTLQSKISDGDLDEAVIAKLLRLADLLIKQDGKAAQQLYKDLAKNDFEMIGSKVMMGLKKLCDCAN